MNSNNMNSNNNNIITNSASFDSMDGCLNFDDDCLSLMSTNSADAALELLNESSVPSQVGEVIDISADDDDDDDSVEILEPLGDFKDGDEEPSEWETVFSPAEEMAKLQTLSNNVSEDWSQAEKDTVSAHNQQDDITSLMTGEIIEPTELSTTTTFNSANGAQPQQQRHHAAPRLLPNTLQRIVAYIAHTETDRRVVLQVEDIIRNCRTQQQRGKRKYQNLSGAIMEHLVDLYGGPRFHEIYQASLNFVPSDYASQRAVVRGPTATASAGAPDTLQLAIAYGMHLARLDQGGQKESSPMHLVRNGVASLNSMSEAERQAFWSYMVNQQG